MGYAVVGHIEWVEFIEVDRLPPAGGIANGTALLEEPAGGGAVAAVQLARLAGKDDFFTALGEDNLGQRSKQRLAELGVTVHAAPREAPTRRAITFVDRNGERTITTVGERLAPNRADSLPWELLGSADGAYFTAGDGEALKAARGARVLTATPRAGAVLGAAGVQLDALVFSGKDAAEATAAEDEVLTRAAGLVVATAGAKGGRFAAAGGETGGWKAAPLPGPVADTYGAGDSFAAALCWALAEGKGRAEALEIAARAGATCMTGRGPYGRQLTGNDVDPAG